MSQHQHTVPPAVGGRPAVPAGEATAVGVPVTAVPLARNGDPDLGATTVEYAMVVLATTPRGTVRTVQDHALTRLNGYARFVHHSKMGS